MSNKTEFIRGFLLILLYFVLAVSVLFWMTQTYKLEKQNRELIEQLELCTNQVEQSTAITNKCTGLLEESLARETKVYKLIDDTINQINNY